MKQETVNGVSLNGKTRGKYISLNGKTRVKGIFIERENACKDVL